jgi:hypothetical protein
MQPVDKPETDYKRRLLTDVEYRIGKVAATVNLIVWYRVMLCERARRYNCLSNLNSHTRLVRRYLLP